MCTLNVLMSRYEEIQLLTTWGRIALRWVTLEISCDMVRRSTATESSFKITQIINA